VVTCCQQALLSRGKSSCSGSCSWLLWSSMVIDHAGSSPTNQHDPRRLLIPAPQLQRHIRIYPGTTKLHGHWGDYRMPDVTLLLPLLLCTALCLPCSAWHRIHLHLPKWLQGEQHSAVWTQYNTFWTGCLILSSRVSCSALTQQLAHMD
jgi:hypothetical protein